MIIAPSPLSISDFSPAPSHTKTQAPPRTGHSRDPADFTPTQALKTAAADLDNLRSLANQLRGVSLQWTASTPRDVISSALNTWTMPIAEGSSYEKKSRGNPKLSDVILKTRLEIPSTKAQVVALIATLDQKALAPLLGNAGGGLSWPIPLNSAQQQVVLDTAEKLPGVPLTDPSTGVLGYLVEATPLTEAERQDPHKALEKLLASPRAEALGVAIRQRLNAIATPTSTCEYVLSAINLGLDRESINQPRRNTVAGFDLGQAQYWGKPVSTLVEAFKAYLIASGKTTPALATIATHVLLGRIAPQLLVKDLPERIPYGSQAWANLCIAVAKVEAEAPGTAPSMTFAQVMQRADAITTPAPASAQQAALVDWAIANGILPGQAPQAFSPRQIEHARRLFNEQQNQRLAASEAINTHIPTRREIALEKLKAYFPNLDPRLFELPLLTQGEPYRQDTVMPLYNPNLRASGYHSMLDAVMGSTASGKWQSKDPRLPMDTFNNRPDLAIPSTFERQFTAAIDARKKAVSTTIRHLISQLPLEDRQRLETGKISFFHESTYDTTPVPDRLTAKNLVLSLKVENAGQASIYQIDIQNLSIRRKDNYVNLKEVTWTDAHFETRQTQFKPGKDMQLGEQPTPDNGVFDSFSSQRSHAIADAFVEHLEVDNPAIRSEAEGSTRHERQLQSQHDAGDFFLNLIPLRSAIVNFAAGNYAEGALDLGLDMFSFLTAGAGAAFKLGKLGSTAISTGAKFARATRVIGVATLGALNPLDGAGDLVRGALKISHKAAKGVVKGVKVTANAGISLLTQANSAIRNTGGSYDLLRANKAHGLAALGTFKAGEHTVDAVAVHHKHHWYAYDPAKNQPFGPPLEDFQPSFTLAPRSPKRHGSALHRARSMPYDKALHSPRVRTPLPDGEYATAMKGKLEPDHFKRETKAATIGKFVKDMFEHYDAVKTRLPPRPVVPRVPKATPVADLLNDVFKTSNGVVLGERHNEMASFKTLFDNVETLKAQGVKRVYFEGLLSRPDLPKGYQDDGIGMLGATGTPRSRPSFETLKAHLEHNGIEVIPLDHYYLTRHKDVKHVYGATREGFGSVQRLQEFNYYATKTIEATSNGEKWVALVGMSHMKTSEGVPGLAEMTGSTAIGVRDHKTLPGSSGFGPKIPAPDPTKALGSADFPGDLRIVVHKDDLAPPARHAAG